MEKQYIFYKVTYVNDGRFYYGSHYGHVNDSYRGSNKIIHLIKKKHGIKSLVRENLKFFSDKKTMFEFESKFLSIYKLDKDPNCLNFTTNGCGGDTWSHMSDDEKEKRKKLLSEKISGSGNGNYNRKFTEEHIKRISDAKKGVPIFTDEHKQKISKRLKKEYSEGIRNCDHLKQYANNRKDCKLTEEHKKSISDGIKSSKKYKESRIKAKETIHKKFLQRVEKFRKLYNFGKSREEIMLILNMKGATYYKYKRIIDNHE